ncbi:hypothetical protein TNCV_2361581 [Trichonephila clavipes]|nr:hypothetical protein TNCV_2361581 [Trichonephila clavipes]
MSSRKSSVIVWRGGASSGVALTTGPRIPNTTLIYFNESVFQRKSCIDYSNFPNSLENFGSHRVQPLGATLERKEGLDG